MDARYEEKTFESYFNTELDGKTDIYFPLGQVQEGIIGLDSAAYSRSWRLWRRVGHPFWFRPPFAGVDLQDIAAEMELYLTDEVKNIPPMKVNLLFQYKRPEFITNSLGKEWTLWNQRYFRYDLYKEQHDLLAHIETSFGNSALVLYAAPAVEDVVELVRLKKSGSIIDNSNFRKASELNGHHRNSYTKAGTYSQACSEPKRIDNFDLIKLINSVDAPPREDNREFLIGFARTISTSLRQTPIAVAYDERLSEFGDRIREFSLFYSLLSMSIFREITGTQWIVSLGGSRPRGRRSGISVRELSCSFPLAVPMAEQTGGNPGLILRVAETRPGYRLTMRAILDIASPDWTHRVKNTEWLVSHPLFDKEVPRNAWALNTPVLGSFGRNYLEQTDELIQLAKELVDLKQASAKLYEMAYKQFAEQRGEAVACMLDDKSSAAEIMARLEITDLCRPTAVEALYDVFLAVKQHSASWFIKRYYWTSTPSGDGGFLAIGLGEDGGIVIASVHPTERHPQLGAIFSRRS